MKDTEKLLLDVWTSLISLRDILREKGKLTPSEQGKLNAATRQINLTQKYFQKDENPRFSDQLPVGSGEKLDSSNP